eukprot:CAMPEP_0175186956 /NCGR_PEP_ID=MMETSP0093-20121207/2658_1 /TAXON_ID=311494 /ORGANISM="Alexandrium monilatum, Strain CCMP3105" /LENGTH=208 /DNA_ID=CAMNT_0016479693 /DNA_START=554 /DNA_END=1181 /DNA_ORIENTATION=-
MAAEHHVFGRDVTVDKAAAVQGLQAPQQQAPQDAGEWPALVPGCRPDSRHEVLQRALEDVHDEVGPVVVAPRIQQEGDPQTPLGPLLRDRLEHARLRLLGGPLQGYLYMIVEVLSLVHTGTSEARTYGAEHVVLPDQGQDDCFFFGGSWIFAAFVTALGGPTFFLKAIANMPRMDLGPETRIGVGGEGTAVSSSNTRNSSLWHVSFSA